MKNKYIIAIFLVLGILNLEAQNFNFSQYNNNPFAIGPACLGEYTGVGKLSTIYRNQWYKMSNNPYKTYGVSAEAKMFNKKVFIGGHLINDEVGDGTFKIMQYSFQIASKVRINKNNYINLGIQSDFNTYSVSSANYSWNSQFDGKRLNKNILSGEVFDKETYNNFNISTGLLWVFEAKEIKYKFGFLARNIIKSNASFFVKPAKYSNLSFVLNGNIEFNRNNILYSPSFTLQRFNNNSYVAKYGLYFKSQYGTQSRYSNYKNISEVYFGLFFRNVNAIIPQVKFNYERKIEFVFSFDIDVSPLREASSYQGAAEIGLNYSIPNKSVRELD